MTTAADNVLGKIREAGKTGVAVASLPDAAGVSRATVTRVLRTLEERELVVRDEDRVRPVLRRGRRLVTTLERDNRVLDAVTGSGSDGLSLVEIAEKTGYPRGGVYQSVWRLARQGRVQRFGATRTARWVAVQVESDSEQEEDEAA